MWYFQNNFPMWQAFPFSRSSWFFRTQYECKVKVKKDVPSTSLVVDVERFDVTSICFHQLPLLPSNNFDLPLNQNNIHVHQKKESRHLKIKDLSNFFAMQAKNVFRLHKLQTVFKTNVLISGTCTSWHHLSISDSASSSPAWLAK